MDRCRSAIAAASRFCGRCAPCPPGDRRRAGQRFCKQAPKGADCWGRPRIGKAQFLRLRHALHNGRSWGFVPPYGIAKLTTVLLGMPMNSRICFAAMFLFASPASPFSRRRRCCCASAVIRATARSRRSFRRKRYGKNAGGYLLEVKARSVVVRAPKGGASRRKTGGRKIRARAGNYAYCSTKKPAVIFYDSRKFYAHLLNIGEAPAGYEIDFAYRILGGLPRQDRERPRRGGRQAREGCGGSWLRKIFGKWGKQREFRRKKKAFKYFEL